MELSDDDIEEIRAMTTRYAVSKEDLYQSSGFHIIRTGCGAPGRPRVHADRSAYLRNYQSAWAAGLTGDRLARRRAQRRVSEAKRRAAIQG